MAKDPAVLFYTSDFLSGTYTMTDAQVGKYIRLLCLQHQKGVLSEKDMINICKEADEEIFSKFIKDGNIFFNQRMRDESERRKKFSESRSNNRKNKTSEKHMNNTSKTYEKHMETENETETINESIKYKIEDCLIISLKDSRFLKSNKTNDFELHRFNEYLEQQGKYLMNPNDYKEYFAKLKGRYPAMLKKEMSVEELREISKKMDQQ